MKLKNHLESIKATVYNAPSIDELKSYIPEFVCLTWLPEIGDLNEFMKSRDLTREQIVDEMFAGRTLPTALETVRVTMLLEGLDMTNVTHIIRHRMFSFSAQSTDPVSMADHDILMNDAFLQHPKLVAKAKILVEDANNLYNEALDAGLSYYDARHYMVRAKEAKYFMSGNVKDWIAFINVRLGRTNQPTSDNIIAMHCRRELIKLYPQIKEQIPVEKLQMHYLKAINEKMNMNTYPPDRLHREWLRDHKVKWEAAEYNHKMPRDEYPHMDNFNRLVEELR